MNFACLDLLLLLRTCKAPTWTFATKACSTSSRICCTSSWCLWLRALFIAGWRHRSRGVGMFNHVIWNDFETDLRRWFPEDPKPKPDGHVCALPPKTDSTAFYCGRCWNYAKDWRKRWVAGGQGNGCILPTAWMSMSIPTLFGWRGQSAHGQTWSRGLEMAFA